MSARQNNSGPNSNHNHAYSSYAHNANKRTHQRTKRQNNGNARERTVTTLTGDTDSNVFPASTEIFAKSEPQEHYSYDSLAMTAPSSSISYNVSQFLPPGQSDLEILENLKELIKSGQHQFYKAVPQPEKLAEHYIPFIHAARGLEENGGYDAQGRRPPRMSKDYDAPMSAGGRRPETSSDPAHLGHQRTPSGALPGIAPTSSNGPIPPNSALDSLRSTDDRRGGPDREPLGYGVPPPRDRYYDDKDRYPPHDRDRRPQDYSRPGEFSRGPPPPNYVYDRDRDFRRDSYYPRDDDNYRRPGYDSYRAPSPPPGALPSRPPLEEAAPKSLEERITRGPPALQDRISAVPSPAPPTASTGQRSLEKRLETQAASDTKPPLDRDRDRRASNAANSSIPPSPASVATGPPPSSSTSAATSTGGPSPLPPPPRTGGDNYRPNGGPMRERERTTSNSYRPGDPDQDLRDRDRNSREPSDRPPERDRNGRYLDRQYAGFSPPSAADLARDRDRERENQGQRRRQNSLPPASIAPPPPPPPPPAAAAAGPHGHPVSQIAALYDRSSQQPQPYADNNTRYASSGPPPLPPPPPQRREQWDAWDDRDRDRRYPAAYERPYDYPPRDDRRYEPHPRGSRPRSPSLQPPPAKRLRDDSYGPPPGASSYYPPPPPLPGRYPPVESGYRPPPPDYDRDRRDYRPPPQSYDRPRSPPRGVPYGRGPPMGGR